MRVGGDTNVGSELGAEQEAKSVSDMSNTKRQTTPTYLMMIKRSAITQRTEYTHVERSSRYSSRQKQELSAAAGVTTGLHGAQDGQSY